MKTLKDLGLEAHLTANYANYVNIGKPKLVVCCGWMDIHEDSGGLGDDNNPIFSVEPLYWDDSAVFVYKPRSKWHKMTKKAFLAGKSCPGVQISGNRFQFNALKYHGLVPENIANKLVESPSFAQTQEYRDFENLCTVKISPKLVWKFK